MNSRKRIRIEIDIYMNESHEEAFRAEHGLVSSERLAPKVYEVVNDRLKNAGP
ncbi:hypothetical protein ACIRPH_05250 [Nocardiopsis sp. NPDC101807]|uniref:hypothetical protein n=1 Tax=Nocardiopsis sp. NPDC101807 TaxID=3364339 RepID=UPI00380A714B